ncbi:hypothetical protein ABIB82_000779 [Bradyrhizobium sp. i1.8.4]|uniref:hypothetical protein n=1 Tax=unclassified Bradyrhizobium TaxID=2631580 RepID=UPI003D1B58BB
MSKDFLLVDLIDKVDKVAEAKDEFLTRALSFDRPRSCRAVRDRLPFVNLIQIVAEEKSMRRDVALSVMDIMFSRAMPKVVDSGADSHVTSLASTTCLHSSAV